MLVEPGVLGFGIRNPTYDRIQNQVPLTEIGIQYLDSGIHVVVSRIKNCTWIPYPLRQRLFMRDFRCRSRLRSAPKHPVARDSLHGAKYAVLLYICGLLHAAALSTRIWIFFNPQRFLSGFKNFPFQDSSGNIGNRACVEVARLDTLVSR